MVSSQLHYTKVNRFMPFLLAEILNFQGSIHRIGVGSFSKLSSKVLCFISKYKRALIAAFPKAPFRRKFPTHTIYRKKSRMVTKKIKFFKNQEKKGLSGNNDF